MSKKKIVDSNKKMTRYSGVRRFTTEWYKRWMPFEAAKMTVQASGIRSRAHYWRWHTEVNPHYIPKFPNRVYTEEWDSWNDYLGTENTFVGYDRQNRLPWTPYWEATRIVQAHNFATKREYLDGHSKLSGNIPKAAREGYPDDWISWPAFLGVTTSSRVTAAQHVVGIVCLCTSTLLSSNIIEVIIAPEGKDQLRDKLNSRSDLRILKAYVWEPDIWPQIKGLFDIMSSESEPGKFTVPNLNALLYEIDNILLIYRE